MCVWVGAGWGGGCIAVVMSLYLSLAGAPVCTWRGKQSLFCMENFKRHDTNFHLFVELLGKPHFTKRIGCDCRKKSQQ